MDPNVQYCTIIKYFIVYIVCIVQQALALLGSGCTNIITEFNMNFNTSDTIVYLNIDLFIDIHSFDCNFLVVNEFSEYYYYPFPVIGINAEKLDLFLKNKLIRNQFNSKMRKIIEIKRRKKIICLFFA